MIGATPAIVASTADDTTRRGVASEAIVDTGVIADTVGAIETAGIVATGDTEPIVVIAAIEGIGNIAAIADRADTTVAATVIDLEGGGRARHCFVTPAYH